MWTNGGSSIPTPVSIGFGNDQSALDIDRMIAAAKAMNEEQKNEFIKQFFKDGSHLTPLGEKAAVFRQ
jgi:hypothetical protein